MKELVGKILENRYRIQEIIGVGGMAVVYKAVDLRDDKTVAIKVLKQEFFEDPSFKTRFVNESKAIAMLSHENIVKIYDVGLNDDLYFIVMEYIDGITLKQYIEQEERLPWREALHFIAQILSALGHAHSMGVVHRDIKPQNIMLLSNGSIRVTDFGIARISNNNTNTMSEKAIGSVHYISPEQVSGNKADFRSDIYSVGVILYEMLTGVTPFDAESPLSVALMQLQSEPKRPRAINPEIPEGLEEITLKAMNKDPKLRYQSTEEMLADIERFKRDPSARFEYKYFQDTAPTISMDTVKKARAAENPESAREEKRKTYVGVLTGILAAFVLIALVIGGVMLAMNQGGGSSGDEVTLPSLLGEVYDAEALKLKYPDFVILEDASKNSEEYEAGQIMEQSPKAGMNIKKGGEVHVTVSLGAKEVEISDYKNQNYRTAELALRNLGLVVEKEEEYSDEVAEGYVIRTDPEKGSMVADGATIRVYVSKGAEVAKNPMPNVVGKTEKEAVKELGEIGIVPVIKQTDSDKAAGTVLEQSVKEGAEVTANTAVELTVSNGASAPSEKEISIVLPADRESFTVVVKLDGATVHEGAHTSAEKVLKLTLSGRGTKILEVFIDGELLSASSGFVNFDE